MKVVFFYITKGNTIFVTNDLVTNTSNMNFDLQNHDSYVLCFYDGIEEISVGIIERKSIFNNNIYKYNIIFIFESSVINLDYFLLINN
jgi:hypothetical protein